MRRVARLQRAQLSEMFGITTEDAVDAKATTFSAIKVDIPAATESLGSGTQRSEAMTHDHRDAVTSGKSKVTLYVYYGAAYALETWNHDGEVEPRK